MIASVQTLFAKTRTVKIELDVIWYVVLPSFLLFFLGLRYKIGGDWINYKEFYDNVETIDLLFTEQLRNSYLINGNEFLEIGFRLVCVFVKSLGVSYQGFVFLLTCFNLYSMYHFIKVQKIPNKFLFLFFYFSYNLLVEFDIIRQALSFYIFLYAVPYLNKSFVKYLLICILATTIHSSAVIFIPMYFFCRKRLTKKFLIVTLCIYFFNFLLGIKALSGLLSILGAISGNSLILTIKTYIELFNFPTHLTVYTLVFSTLLGLVAMNWEKVEQLSDEHQNLLKFFLAYAYISVFFSEIKVIEERFVYFFYFGVAFVFALLPTFYNGLLKIATLTVSLLYAGIRITGTLGNDFMILSYTYNNYLFVDDRTDSQIMARINEMQEKTEAYYQERVNDNK
ncbi:MAG: EpsG family protein [Chitinophaga sp.]|uniref:EpsG family protein n=1 Tax=Chitinophaga sp. TaxID=1869181 RepID=UPI0025BCA5D3|nr:EpsG family protein [Chitinophaga sp.]MBV8254350.1 EpsG family protein [Chitinophaga sp.]